MMSMKPSITHTSELVNALEKIKILNTFTDCIRKNILRIVESCFLAGYRGKTVDFARCSDRHRTSLSHFLSKGIWESAELETKLRQTVIEKVYQHSQDTGQPVLCIIDDTIASKTRPSSQAVHPIEAASYHMSHLKGRMDYGHQAIGVMLACGELILNYAIILYDKSQSKIDLVSSLANELPVPPNVGYLLCDSWYTCDKVMDAFLCKGFYMVAGLKTNRILYPYGIRTPLNKFAKILRKTDAGVQLVTVGKRKYWIYRYDGPINGADGAVVILTYPENAFGNPKALRAFLCTNADLSAQCILNLYTKRWPIEIFFRTTKGKLALDKYQMRSASGIRRFWLIMSLAHYLCCAGSGVLRTFSDGYKYWQNAVQCSFVRYIYECGKTGIPIAALGVG